MLSIGRSDGIRCNSTRMLTSILALKLDVDSVEFVDRSTPVHISVGLRRWWDPLILRRALTIGSRTSGLATFRSNGM